MGKIIVAESAGFCFGVDNAVKLALKTLQENNGKTGTYGELIHNRQVSDRLAADGIYIAHSLEQLQKDEHIVIRAHGIGEAVYDELNKKQVHIHDAT